MTNTQILYPSDWTDYELIDSGNGDKLERIANYTMVRPDPRIIWQKMAEPSVWQKADAVFIRSTSLEGHWDIKTPPPNNWDIKYHNLCFSIKPTEFKHIGVFPEQAVNWEWIIKIINNYQLKINNSKLKILNLFAYTGGATLAALSAGADVTHVDSVKSAIDWANANVKASNLTGKPVRWIIEDVYKFVSREAKRGNKYDGIIMDPPRFGRGTKGEVWKLEKDLPKLLHMTKQILSEDLILFLVNVYTADISPITLENTVRDILPKAGILESGELALKESYGKRLVPNGIFARWSK
jgi:23S rRNA (cytosine1962-C5)-methyltransferase